MANMSYCRMTNTSKDLQDCWENWDVESDEEIRAKAKIIALAKKIVAYEADDED
jgi:hypothetical protein